MSYDITFIPVEAGQSLDDALAASSERYATMDPSPLSDAQRAAWSRLVTRCKTILDGRELEESTRYSSCELSDSSTGMQVAYYGREAAVTVPYWHGNDKAQRVMTLVYEIARAVAEETGLVGVDQQLGQAITEVDQAAAVETLSSTTEQVEGS